MVRKVAESQEFAEKVRRRIDAREIIDHLMAQRAALELSQKEIAAKMSCSQGRISKLESGKDENLRIGDFAAYADALGLEMMIVLGRKDRTIVEEIKHHILTANRLLGRLAKMAAGDKTMSDGVCDFIGEAAYNACNGMKAALRMLDKAAAKGMKMPKESAPLIQTEASDSGESCRDEEPEAISN
jgi:transcriptional regulator with XRE-family HTH domain